MNMRIILTIVAVALGFTACKTSIPTVDSYPITTQRRQLSVHHWEVAVREFIQFTAKNLSNQCPKGTSLTVEASPNATQFERGYLAILVAELTKAGYLVAPGSRYQVGCYSQVVRHNPLSGSGFHPETKAAVCLTGQQLGDVRQARTELLLVTSIRESTNIRLALQNIFYLNDRDTQLYVPDSKPASPSTLPLTKAN